MSGRRSERTRGFYFGVFLALAGYTSMIFSAASGINSTFYVQTAQIGAVIFVLGAVIALLNP
jgi:hypothetical protein